MPALPRMSLQSQSQWSQFRLSSQRRARLRTTLRKFEVDTAAQTAPQARPMPGWGFHLWLPLLLLPLMLVFMVSLSVVRVLGSAARWIVVWCGGFLAGGLMAWLTNTLIGGGASAATVWAAGGFLGLVLLSSFYGMCLEWLVWLYRHENNPYAGLVSLSPEQEANRVKFAKSLHWPAALASAVGGAVFSWVLFPVIAGTNPDWPSLATWAGMGGLALAVQGLLLGLYLGWKRNRVVFDASQDSLGEFIGWHLAGNRTGGRAAVGWGIGYALHQLPAGLLAGLVLGGLTRLFLA